MILYARGNVLIGPIGKIVDHEDVKVWEIRLRTDYPDVTVYEAGGDKDDEPRYAGVWLAAQKVSRHVDGRFKKPTELRYEFPDDEQWSVFAQRGPTRVQIAAYRRGVPTYE